MTLTVNRADAELRDRVLQQLARSRDMDAHDIGVRAEQGRVTLVGSARTFPEKLAAAAAIRHLFGVRAIANEIVVRDPVPVTDADLERHANAALAACAGTPPSSVWARVAGGGVLLEGTVDWLYQRTAAEVAVAYLPGVRAVDNRIALTAGAGPAPLQEQIEQALMRTAGLEWKRICVTARGGRVRLTGAVFSLMEKDEAERAVWSIRGVLAVQNDLDVVARRWW